ncbi:hypothetical protein [Caloramator proteoclasticus]|uniref:Amidase n=1 Tax=Caloramator proteoclasticus DSM 10124 TaxID=1121262 RepID=A0A1M4XU48_9CLOT|nr:hypothetical protein [Caloramator proteoclasticus]SHE96866.1 hypothetical protein SAMN02746091_01497 [Caloramator proteoclasticus DSM 10124]
MLKRGISFLLIFFILISISTIPATAKSKVNSKGKRQVIKKVVENKRLLSSTIYKVPYGTWLWDTNKIVKNADYVVKFLNANGFTEVYIQIDQSLNYSYYRNFIKNANKYGIKVYALDGNPEWVLKNERRELNKFLNWVVKYNSKVKEEKFYGVHLDSEPYLLELWNSSRNQAVLEYMDYISYLKDFGVKNNLNIAVDIPFWFDEIIIKSNNMSLAEYVVSIVDIINVMTYRDKAGTIIDIVKNEMEYAKKYNKKIMISVETGNTSEGDYVTFYQEGINFMWNEIDKVNDYYKTNYNNYGFAVHYLENIMEMKK